MSEIVRAPSSQVLEPLAGRRMRAAVNCRLLGCLSLSSFQVLKSPLLDLALSEAEFDSGKINVSNVLQSLPRPRPSLPTPGPQRCCPARVPPLPGLGLPSRQLGSSSTQLRSGVLEFLEELVVEMLDLGKPGISACGYCSGSSEGNQPLRQIGPPPAGFAPPPGSEPPSL